MKVHIRICECGYQHHYYREGRSKNNEVPDEPCGKCGKPLRLVKPGELGKMKLITSIKCPACELSFPISRKKIGDIKTIVCPNCGYGEVETGGT